MSRLTLLTLLLTACPLMAQDAAAVRKGTGMDAGLAVHLGTIDGQLELELASEGRMLVHGLALDEDRMQVARRAVQKGQRTGIVTVDRWVADERLPYADNLVNLVIADVDALGNQAPAEAEILRVLAPGRGAAWLKRKGAWEALKKPMTPGLDGWEQFTYDATGNIVSRDTHVKPSTGIQWITGTQETDDDNGYRFSGGKLVYRRRVTSPQGNQQAVRLTCRDAFNGLPFWTKDTVGGQGNAPMIGKYTPFIFADGRVYTVLGTRDQPLVEIDTSSGELLRTFDESGKTFAGDPSAAPEYRKAGFMGGNWGKGWLAYHDGVFYQAIGKEVLALDPRTGKRVWHHKVDDYVLLQRPVVNPDSDEVYVFGCNKEARRSLGGGRNPGHRAAAVLAFDRKTGKQKWKLPIDDRHVTHAVYGEKTLVLYSAQDNGPEADEWIFAAVDTPTAKVRWSYPMARDPQLWSGMQRREMMIRGGKLYLMSHGISVFDLQSGKAELHYNSGNTRCEASKATENYLVMAFSQFVDYRKEKPEGIRVGISRGSCGSGFFPAYGMVHYLPNNCNCEAYVRFNVTASSEPVREPIADERRLVQGSAAAPKSASSTWPAKDEWPMFLHGPGRDGWTTSPLPAKLAEGWTQLVQPMPAGKDPLTADWIDTNDYTGPISAPVVDGDRVYVAVREEHRVDALDARTGKKAWSFEAGGRIATPPTIYQGLCLFGGRDGWVYALRADNGELVWRFQAEPYDRNIVAFSQVESTWPLLGSIVIQDGVAVAIAGYHPEANGGLFIYGLDPSSGKPRWKTVLDRRPEWVDLTTKNRLDQPHPTARPIGGFQANVVVNNLAYGEGDYIRFSGATLHARTGKLQDPEAAKKHGYAGIYAIDRPPTQVNIFSDRMTQYRRHYFTEGYYGPYGSFSKLMVTFPGANEPVGCHAYAYSGKDAVILLDSKTEAVIRRYDATKLKDRLALQAEDTPTWTQSVQSIIGADKAQKFYHFSSLIVAGDTVVLAGRIRGRNDQPTPGPDKVGEGILRTFDLKSGASRQAFELPAAPTINGLAVAHGTLFVACEDGSLRTFAAAK